MKIAVIGAGPGGGAAALHLARAGAPVTFYALSKRGEKPCGGGLPDYLLPRLDGFDPAALPRAEPARVRIDAGLGFSVRRPVEGLSIFRRRDLDAALADAAAAAGARRVDEKVVEIGWSPPGDGARPTVRTARGGEEAFDVLIAADGARGISRRSLAGLPKVGPLFVPRGESIGMGASLDGCVSDDLVLSLPDVGDAYGWIFPRPGGVSVGVAYTPEDGSGKGVSDGAARSLLSSLLKRRLPSALGTQNRGVQPKYRYPIPVYGPWTLPAVREAARRRVLLVGDAAAVADPLTREGIRQSMLSGLWAAESVLEDMEGGGGFRPETYPDRLESALEPELGRARRAASLFFEGRLGQAMVPVCRFHPGIGRVLGDLLTCRQPYRGLSRRLLRAAAFLPAARDSEPLGAAPPSP